MLNIGVGFMAFGLMLWLYEKMPLLGARKRLTTTARIVGYMQFPADKTTTDISIFRGAHFRWTRVVTFKNPQTGQTLEMWSNPVVFNPEPIDTVIEISFNPEKINPEKDFVWVQGGMRDVKIVARTSIVTG